MIDKDDCFLISILPKKLASGVKGLAPEVRSKRAKWPTELRVEYGRLRAEFTADKGQFASWIKRDRDSRMSPAAKCVALYLLDCLNFETGRCDPSQQTIADE